MGRTIVVGDIHGCALEFDDLLRSLGFAQGVDRVVLVGDLVARGPDSAGVVELARSCGAWAVRGAETGRVRATGWSGTEGIVAGACTVSGLAARAWLSSCGSSAGPGRCSPSLFAARARAASDPLFVGRAAWYAVPDSTTCVSGDNCGSNVACAARCRGALRERLSIGCVGSSLVSVVSTAAVVSNRSGGADKGAPADS